PTLDNGLTFAASLTNPFPSGALNPTGSSLGLATFLGKNVTTVPIDRKQARSARWSIGIERQLPGSWIVEAAYIGSHGYDLTTYIDVNPVPAQFLSTAASRDTTTINLLEGTVTNPFAGLVPGTNLNGGVVARGQLLRPYPQFVAN